MVRNSLQEYTATRCNTLKHTATPVRAQESEWFHDLSHFYQVDLLKSQPFQNQILKVSSQFIALTSLSPVQVSFVGFFRSLFGFIDLFWQGWCTPALTWKPAIQCTREHDHRDKITRLFDLSDQVCCSVWQCVAVCCSVLQCAAVCCNIDKITRLFDLSDQVCCSVWQCVAVYCSVLQCATL